MQQLATASRATSRPIAVTVPLSRPLTTHEGELRAIPLRKPTFGEFIAIGQIETVIYSGADGALRRESKFDLQRLMRWAVELSGQDHIILATLDAEDAYALTKAVSDIVNVFVMGNFKPEPTNSG